MANLSPRNILICVVPAVVILLSVFWFRKKKKKPDEVPPNQNTSTIPKTVAFDSQTNIYSSVESNLDFSNTLSDASSISSPESSIRKDSSCESPNVGAGDSTEVFSVSNVIEHLSIQEISFDKEEKVFANHNSQINIKEKCENMKRIASLDDEHLLTNGGNVIEPNKDSLTLNLLEAMGNSLHNSGEMLKSSVSSDEQVTKSLNQSYVLSNGLYSNDLNFEFEPEDQNISNITDSDLDGINDDQLISKIQNTFFTQMLNDQNKTNLLTDSKKLSEADSHSSVLDENSVSSLSDESDRHADFKSKDSPSSVFDGNSICDESEKTDGSNEQIVVHLKTEESSNDVLDCVNYGMQSAACESNEQYSVQLSKNSFFTTSVLSENEISSSKLDENVTNLPSCLQSSESTIPDSLLISLNPVCDSNDAVLEHNNQYMLLKEADSCNNKDFSSPKASILKTISSIFDEDISHVPLNKSCNQTDGQSGAATSLSCDTTVSSSTDETTIDKDLEVHSNQQLDSISSIQSSISDTLSVKTQDSHLESLNQNKVSDLDVNDVKSSGVIPGLIVYEFELPQELCGRLIGRQGKHVKSIKERTNANVFIKRHPFDTNLKTVVVEGSRTAVNEALDVIRRKFPPSQFPTVTLLQTNLIGSHGVSLPESLQLHLPEGASCDVILSSLVSAGHFFLQQPTHPTYPSLSTLDQYMISCYSQVDTPLLPHPVEAGVICASSVMNGWFRAQVIYVYENRSECEIKFVDYGGFSQVMTSSLRQIRSDFMTLPFQASECYLANVRPVDRNAGWSAEATSVFEEMAQGQILQALLVEYAEDGIPCVHLYRVQGVSNVFINRELVEQGLAVWVDNGHWDPH